MIDAALWQKGLLIEDYISRMMTYQKEMTERVRDVRITPSEKQKLRELTLERKIVVFTEAGCRDSLMNLPILIKMAECALILEVRIYPRTENPKLRDFFDAQGLKNIPLFWIMDSNFRPLGTWMERSAPATKQLKRWKQANPEYDEIHENTELTEDEKDARLKPLRAQLVDEMWNWYDTGLQSFTISEIMDILKKN